MLAINFGFFFVIYEIFSYMKYFHKYVQCGSKNNVTKYCGWRVPHNCSWPILSILVPDSVWRCHLTSLGNPTVEIRRSYDRLISTMGFPILVRLHLYIDSRPWTPFKTIHFSHFNHLLDGTCADSDVYHQQILLNELPLSSFCHPHTQWLPRRKVFKKIASSVPSKQLRVSAARVEWTTRLMQHACHAKGQHFWWSST